MEIRGTQNVKIDVDEYEMRDVVKQWLRKKFNIGEHDYVSSPMSPREKAEDFIPLMVRQEDNSTHKSSTCIVENPKPATPVEIAVWTVLEALREMKF